MLQNPYGQGYIGSYVMDKVRQGCEFKSDAPWKSTAQTDQFIDSGTVFVDISDVDTYVMAITYVSTSLISTNTVPESINWSVCAVDFQGASDLNSQPCLTLSITYEPM